MSDYPAVKPSSDKIRDVANGLDIGDTEGSPSQPGDSRSELAREALTHRYRESSETEKPQSFFGFDPLPPRGGPVSNELIDKLREEDLG